MTRPDSEPSPFEVFKMTLLICIPLAFVILAVLCVIWVVG